MLIVEISQQGSRAACRVFETPALRILPKSKCFFNTKKAFKKLYMFYFETFRIILNPYSVRKWIKNHFEWCDTYT